MYKDPEKQAAYYRAYREKHLETLRAYGRAYYAANRERINEERKKLRAAARARKKRGKSREHFAGL